MSSNSGIDRRQFLTGTAGAFLLAMLNGEEVRAQAQPSSAQPAPAGPPVRCAVIGLGVQGRMNLRAMIEVFPEISEVRMFDPIAGQSARYQADMQPLLPGAAFIDCATPKYCVTGADVVITCSPIVEKPERFVEAAWLKADCLAIAVDYDSAFDAATMNAAASFTTDNAGQYLWTREHGVYFQNGYPDKAGLHSDLGEICAGKKAGLRSGRRAAVLMGIALDDVMTGHLIYQKALERKVGAWVQL